MKKTKIFVVILVTITLYANIAWVVGSYYYHNVANVKAENLTTLGKIAAGGWSFAAQNTSLRNEGWITILFFGVVWPIGLFIVAGSWVVYVCYYTGWFIFAGGGVRLLGLVS